jgi:hypothetical protein
LRDSRKHAEHTFVPNAFVANAKLLKKQFLFPYRHSEGHKGGNLAFVRRQACKTERENSNWKIE